MTRDKNKSRDRIDGTALGTLLVAYSAVIGLFILWFYPIAPAQYGFNPGLAAYQPPPATVIPDMPARVVTEHHAAPPPVELRSRPEQPRTTVPASTGAPEPTNLPAAAEALASNGAFASTEPAAAAVSPNEHALGVRKPKHSRSSPPPREQHAPTRAAAAAYPGYSGGQPF